MPRDKDPAEEYVGAVALALALGVHVYTLYRWVAEGFIEDKRNARGHGRRHFFDIGQVFVASALAPASKARSWTRKKYLADQDAFNEALDKYMAARGRGMKPERLTRSRIHYLVKDRGYFEGWDFGDLEKAAGANWMMAVRIQRDMDSIQEPREQYETHAAA